MLRVKVHKNVFRKLGQGCLGFRQSFASVRSWAGVILSWPRPLAKVSAPANAAWYAGVGSSASLPSWHATGASLSCHFELSSVELRERAVTDFAEKRNLYINSQLRTCFYRMAPTERVHTARSYRAPTLTAGQNAAEWLAEPAYTSQFPADFLCWRARLSSAIRSCSPEWRGWNAAWATPAWHAPCWAPTWHASCWTPTWHAPWPRHGPPSLDEWSWHESCLQVCFSAVHANAALLKPSWSCQQPSHLHKLGRLIDR